MNRSLLQISIAIGIIIGIACSGKSKKETPATYLKTDTSWTVVAYSYDWNLNDHRITTARRIIQDMEKMVAVDSSGGTVTSEKKRIKDTFYLVPIFEPVMDSTKKIIKTVIGKDSLRVTWTKLPPELLLVDYNKHFVVK